MYSEAFLVFCDPHVTEPSSADVDAPLGEFAIICSFSLKRLHCITRIIAL